jgi:anthranilate phosphoribosyltransferase
MLTKDKIDDLVNCRLPQDVACHYLREVSEETLSPGIMALAIASVRETSLPESLELFADFPLLFDCSGTGGSGISHYNTSTTIAFILAAAGLTVTKFGNRAANSLSGSFDLLDRLGIGAILPPRRLPQLLTETNLAFLFAPQFYPALANLAPIRKAVGCRTIFNLIGPLLNPARPTLRLMGTPSRVAQDLVAQYLSQSGEVRHALIVNADSGLDEIDALAKNRLVNVIEKDIHDHEYEHGQECQGQFTRPLSVEDNVAIFQALMSGELTAGNYYHALVCLNAGAAFTVASVAANLTDGAKLADEILSSGQARDKYEEYRRVYASYAC